MFYEIINKKSLINHPMICIKENEYENYKTDGGQEMIKLYLHYYCQFYQINFKTKK